MLPYLVPEVDVVMLQPGQTLLNLSNYGNPGAPGSGYDGGDIIPIDLPF